MTRRAGGPGRVALLAKVHIGKKDLGLDDDTYRALLERVTRCSSAKALSEHELERVVAELRRLGWTGETTKRGRAPSAKPHIRKVWAVWRALAAAGGLRSEEPRAALRAFCERMVGVTDPEWLDPEQARLVTEAIKHWTERLARAAAESEGT